MIGPLRSLLVLVVTARAALREQRARLRTSARVVADVLARPVAGTPYCVASARARPASASRLRRGACASSSSPASRANDITVSAPIDREQAGERTEPQLALSRRALGASIEERQRDQEAADDRRARPSRRSAPREPASSRSSNSQRKYQSGRASYARDRIGRRRRGPRRAARRRTRAGPTNTIAIAITSRSALVRPARHRLRRCAHAA